MCQIVWNKPTPFLWYTCLCFDNVKAIATASSSLSEKVTVIFRLPSTDMKLIHMGQKSIRVILFKRLQMRKNKKIAIKLQCIQSFHLTAKWCLVSVNADCVDIWASSLFCGVRNVREEYWHVFESVYCIFVWFQTPYSCTFYWTESCLVHGDDS